MAPTFMSSTRSLPTDAIAAATSSDRSAHVWDYGIGGVGASFAQVAGLSFAIAKGLPRGEFVVSSDVSVIDMAPYGAAVRGQGNMAYDSRSSESSGDVIAVSGTGNISMLFNSASGVTASFKAMSHTASGAAVLTNICDTELAATFGATTIVVDHNIAGPLVNVTVSTGLDFCQQTGANEALLLGMNVALSEKDFNLDADVTIDVSSAALSQTLAGEPLAAKGRIGVSLLGTQVFNLTETSNITVSANGEGFESSHTATVDVLSTAVEVDIPILSVFSDNPFAEIDTTVAIDGAEALALKAMSAVTPTSTSPSAELHTTVAISGHQTFMLDATSVVTTGTGDNEGGFASSHALHVNVLNEVIEVNVPTLDFGIDSPYFEVDTSVVMGETEIFAFSELSTATFGVGADTGGFASTHQVNFRILNTMDLELEVGNLDFFMRQDIALVEVPRFSVNGESLITGSIKQSLECSTQCPCYPTCSVAKLLVAGEPGNKTEFGLHGFSAKFDLDLQQGDQFRLNVDLPVEWETPSGDVQKSTLTVGGGLWPVCELNGESIFNVEWITFIAGSEYGSAPPASVTVTDENLFKLTSDMRFVMFHPEPETYEMEGSLTKQQVVTGGGAGGIQYETILTGLENVNLDLLAYHRFWPEGAGFRSSHTVDINDGNEHVVIDAFDLFTGPEVSRLQLQHSGNGADGELFYVLQLASPIGWGVAQAVDATALMMDAIAHDTFFYHDYANIMAPYVLE